MKKILFGSASAILAVIGFSSFKSNKGSAGPSYYWFEVPGTVLKTNTHATFTQIGGASAFLAFEQQQNIDVSCPGGNDICLVGYTLGQIRGFSGVTPTGLKTISGVTTAFKTLGGVSKGN